MPLFRRRNLWWIPYYYLLWLLVFAADYDRDHNHLVCNGFRHGNNPSLVLWFAGSRARASDTNNNNNVPPIFSRRNHPSSSLRSRRTRLILRKETNNNSDPNSRRATAANNNNHRMISLPTCGRGRQKLLLPIVGRRPFPHFPRTAKRPTTTTTTTTTTILRGGSTVLLSATLSSPGLSTWLPPALLCGLAYALYNLFLKQASSSIDPLLGGVLLQLVAAVLGTGLLLFVQLTTTNNPATTSAGAALKWNKVGVAWAMAAGVAVGLAEILSFIISGMGVPASKSIPTIVGGSVVLGTVLGVLWLGERLTLRGWLGIVLIAIGIGLVGIDPGTSSLH